MHFCRRSGSGITESSLKTAPVWVALGISVLKWKIRIVLEKKCLGLRMMCDV